MKQFISPDEARQIIFERVATLPAETVPHAQALKRTLAQDIISPVALPPFDNSAMDGYALRAADVAQASETSPARLRVLETIAAGARPEYSVEHGACSKIMTGAPLPDGADAVVMREETDNSKTDNSKTDSGKTDSGKTDNSEDEVLIFAAAKPGQNIRRAGEDIARGETALPKGTVIRAAEWGLLASLEQAEIPVFRQPRIALIITGDELVEVGQPLQNGQIRDSNSYTLMGLAQACDVIIAEKHRTNDDVAAMQSTLRECAARCDAIITSGGVSAGDFDPVRDALHEIAEIHFWKIKTKPGGPVMFATLKGGQSRESEYSVPVFGLPGNPVSVMVAWEQYVRPAMLKMQGRRHLRRVELPVIMDAPLRSPHGKTEFARVSVRQDGNAWRAAATGEQGSGRLSTMTRANALLVIPADINHVEAGDTLSAQMTDWPEIE
jgi:molybdopterin molybdotransferase